MSFIYELSIPKQLKHILKKNNLKTLYSSDELIFMDQYSSLVFELFKEVKPNQEILEKIKITNMKCIKSIRTTKEVELGEIKRVDDKTAQNMVGSVWQYVSKTEWKSSIRTNSEPIRKQVIEDVEQVTEKIDRKPYKKGQKPEKKYK